MSDMKSILSSYFNNVKSLIKRQKIKYQKMELAGVKRYIDLKLQTENLLSDAFEN